MAISFVILDSGGRVFSTVTIQQVFHDMLVVAAFSSPQTRQLLQYLFCNQPAQPLWNCDNFRKFEGYC